MVEGLSANRLPGAEWLELIKLHHRTGGLILVEGGPQLLGAFYAEHALDEQVLILAPQIAGRDVGDQGLTLVTGRTFAPRRPLRGTLMDVRRGSSHLFLRYSFPSSQVIESGAMRTIRCNAIRSSVFRRPHRESPDSLPTLGRYPVEPVPYAR